MKDIKRLRKEKRKKKRKEEIFCAARTVFADKGFEKAAMDAIAKKSGFSKGAIYFYFKNKEDLFISMIEDQFDKITEIIEDVVESKTSPLDKIKIIVLKMLSIVETDSELTSKLMLRHGEFMNKHHKIFKKIFSKWQVQIELIARVIKEGIKIGVFKNIDPYFSARAVFGFIHTVCASWKLYGKENSPEKDTDMVTEIFLNGLVASLFTKTYRYHYSADKEKYILDDKCF